MAEDEKKDSTNNNRKSAVPLIGILMGVLVFVGFPFLWTKYLSGFATFQNLGYLIGALLGVIVVLVFAYRSRANLLAQRLTKDVYASREWFRSLYDYSPTPYVLLTEDGHIRQPNKAALRLYGMTAEELYNRPFPELFVYDDRDNARQYFEFFKTPLPVVDREMRVVNAKGQEKWVLLSIFSLGDARQKEQFGLVALFDITGRKEIEKAKTDFVSLASHQLRTPLATMKWYLEGLLAKTTGPLNEKQEKYVEKIYGKNQAIIDLVGLLLNISRIELGAFKIEPKDTLPSALVDITLEGLALFIRRKGITIEKKYESTGPFKTDPKLAAVIFENLLSNAVKYTPEGGKITVTLGKKGTDVEVSVSDTGYGIAPEVQEKIFTKLFRAENAQQVDPDGSGLGLYLTKQIVGALGGTIGFTSALNKGTTFTVTIPSL